MTKRKRKFNSNSDLGTITKFWYLNVGLNGNKTVAKFFVILIFKFTHFQYLITFFFYLILINPSRFSIFFGFSIFKIKKVRFHFRRFSITGNS